MPKESNKGGDIVAEEKERLEQGCLDLWVDELVPCLKDTETGELKQTVVFKVQSRAFLKQFKKKDGWHINWYEVPKEVEVYALALRDTNEVQGLIAVRDDKEAEACFMHWACTAPWNNKHEFGSQRYEGVGGHLFAIAVDKSMEWGYDGAAYGYAANEELVKHYVETFHAEFVPIRHPYQIVLGPYYAKKLLEVYTYEWN